MRTEEGAHGAEALEVAGQPAAAGPSGRHRRPTRQETAGQPEPLNVLAIDQGTSATKALLVGPGARCSGRGEVPVRTRASAPTGWRPTRRSCPGRCRGRVAGAGGGAGARPTRSRWPTRARPCSPGTVAPGSALPGDRLAGPAVGGVCARLADRPAGLAAAHRAAARPVLRRAEDDLAAGEPDRRRRRHHHRHLAAGPRWAAATSPTRRPRRGRCCSTSTRRGWSAEACAAFGLDPAALPEVADCAAGALGETAAFGGALPVTGLAVDQQAALLGRGLPGRGRRPSAPTGRARSCSPPPGACRRQVRLGPVRVGGVAARRRADLLPRRPGLHRGARRVRWLAERRRAARARRARRGRRERSPDAGGVTFVPALAGLGAPHWAPATRAGCWPGCSLGTTRGHLVRAVVEGIAASVALLAAAAAADLAPPLGSLRVDGGLTRSRLLMQAQADLLQVPVEVCRVAGRDRARGGRAGPARARAGRRPWPRRWARPRWHTAVTSRRSPLTRRRNGSRASARPLALDAGRRRVVTAGRPARRRDHRGRRRRRARSRASWPRTTCWIALVDAATTSAPARPRRTPRSCTPGSTRRRAPWRPAARRGYGLLRELRFGGRDPGRAHRRPAGRVDAETSVAALPVIEEKAPAQRVPAMRPVGRRRALRGGSRTSGRARSARSRSRTRASSAPGPRRSPSPPRRSPGGVRLSLVRPGSPGSPQPATGRGHAGAPRADRSAAAGWSTPPGWAATRSTRCSAAAASRIRAAARRAHRLRQAGPDAAPARSCCRCRRRGPRGCWSRRPCTATCCSGRPPRTSATGPTPPPPRPGWPVAAARPGGGSCPGWPPRRSPSTYAGLRAATEHSDYQIRVDAERRYACVGRHPLDRAVRVAGDRRARGRPAGAKPGWR